MNRYITQRIKVHGRLDRITGDIVWLDWPDTIGEERDVSYALLCTYLNPTKSLLDKLEESKFGPIEVEGDVSQIVLWEYSLSDHIAMYLKNCIIYLPRYRMPIDAAN